VNLLRTLATVSSLTLVSRVLGFVRDTVIARAFGAGLFTDAFFVAFRIPNLLRRLFAEGAFSQAFVPVLAEYKNRHGDEPTHRLIDEVGGWLALALAVVSIIGILAAPLIIYVSAPGFRADAGKFQLTVDLLRVSFPYIALISLTAFAGGILNTFGNFAVPAFTPSLLNVAFIVFALFLAQYFDPPIRALAWAVIAGGVLQLGFQLPYLAKLGVLPRPRLTKAFGSKRIFKLMGPAIFGVSVAQISLLINTIFASYMATGSVSWLYYADRLMEFPSGLLGVALSTILLPSLAKHHANRAAEKYSKLLDWGLRLALMLTLPAALALALLAVPLIGTLFRYGEFALSDLWRTREALIAYSVGLTGIILVKILAPGFYAKQNIRTPVKIAIITLLATQLMNVLFIHVLKLAHAGLALSIGLAACLNALLLFFGLRRSETYQPQPGWAVFTLKLLGALVVLGLVLWFAMGEAHTWTQGRLLHRAARLTALVALGAASYFGALWLMGFRLRDFLMRSSG
jgi:putative peptidoglycan lipid II flippase